MVDKVCEFCKVPVSPPWECAVFLKPGVDERVTTEKDISGYRCFPCDDQIVFGENFE